MPKIVHIALKVKDLDKAEAFYRKVFGFTPVRTEDVRDHTSCHLSDGVIDLSLMQYEGESPESLLSGRGPCIHHFGIEVEDLQTASNELREAGCEILSPAGEIPIKFRDPNGVVAELVPPGRYK
jgi:lactoylglutathione lyase